MATRIAVTASHGSDSLADATGAAYVLALGDLPKGIRVESVSVDVDTVHEVGNPMPVMFYVEVTVEAER